jgi:hypothetical protein
MEVERLIVKADGKNVDHTPTNSKDVADAVANLVWFFKGQYLKIQTKDRPENKLNMFYVKAV